MTWLVRKKSVESTECLILIAIILIERSVRWEKFFSEKFPAIPASCAILN